MNDHIGTEALASPIFKNCWLFECLTFLNLSTFSTELLIRQATPQSLPTPKTERSTWPSWILCLSGWAEVLAEVSVSCDNCRLYNLFISSCMFYRVRTVDGVESFHVSYGDGGLLLVGAGDHICCVSIPLALLGCCCCLLRVMWSPVWPITSVGKDFTLEDVQSCIL